MTDCASILLVAGNEQDILLVRRALLNRALFNHLHTAKNAVEAMNYLEGAGRYRDRDRFPFPDTVLLDLNLTGIDGFEMLAWIRQHPEFTDLRVVVLVCPHSVRDASRAYQLGADSFLLKTADLDDPATLERTLKCRPAKRPSGRQPVPVLAFG